MKKKFFEWVQNVKARVQKIQQYKAYKVVTSKALDRTISITMAGFAILGITAAAVPAAIVGLTTVAVGAIIDTLTLRNTRRLVKENKLLAKNRDSINEQNEILKQNPKLSEALEGELIKPNRENKKSVTERYVKPNPKTNGFDFGKAVLKNIANSIFSIGKAAMSGKVLGTAIAIGKSAKSLYSENSVNNAISNKRQEFYQAIDSERDKPDTPGYNSLRELRESVREQRIQELALKAMEEDMRQGKYNNYSKEQLKEKFQEKKLEVAKRVEEIAAQRHPVIAAIRSFGKNFMRAHNPFSKYNNPAQLEVRKPKERAAQEKPVLQPKTIQEAHKIGETVSVTNKPTRARSSTAPLKKKPPQAKRLSL